MALAFVFAMTLYIRNFICIPAILLCATVGTAAAGQLDLVVNGRSHHVNSEFDWNENNYGVGLEYQLDTSSRWIWTVNGNAFKDSLDNISYMAGGSLKRRLFQSKRQAGYYFDAGLVAFVMSRADINDYLPFPGILPTLSFGLKNVGINLTYLPKVVVRDIAQAKVVDPNVGGVFFLQFKLRLLNRTQ
jgi:hypothetical protein